MIDKNLEYQHELVSKHIAKAEQCIEYSKNDDAQVHLMIAQILNNGAKAKLYERESLDNLRSALM